MTPTQRVVQSGREQLQKQLEVSKLRLAYNEEDIAAEKREEIKAELKAAEASWQDAINAHFKALDEAPDPGPIADGDAGVREFNELYKRAKLTNMILAAYENKELDGAEAEIRQAFLPNGGRHAQSIPLAMFLDDREGMEIRQDTATVINAVTGRRETMPIAQRVFGMSEVAYMGARFITVSGGQQDFPFISSGVSGTAKDENEPIHAGQGRISIVSATPKEIGVAYLWGMTSRLRFNQGELESALRQDARAALSDYTDALGIIGQEADATNDIPAVNGLMQRVAQTGNAPTQTATALDMLKFGAQHVDAIWARTDDNVRYLMAAGLWQDTAYLQLHAQSDLLVKNMLSGRFMASHHLPTGTRSSGVADSRLFTYAPDMDSGEFIIATWEDVRVIFDTVSTGVAQNRQERLSLSSAVDPVLRRTNPWINRLVQHTNA